MAKIIRKLSPDITDEELDELVEEMGGFELLNQIVSLIKNRKFNREQQIRAEFHDFIDSKGGSDFIGSLFKDEIAKDKEFQNQIHKEKCLVYDMHACATCFENLLKKSAENKAQKMTEKCD